MLAKAIGPALPPIAAIVVLTSLPVGNALAKSPNEFIQDAIKGDNSEIALGNLAATSASSQGVKEFGETLAADHGKAKKEAAAVATKMGVEPPGGLKTEAKTELDRLNALSGSNFDQEFVEYMIKDHQKDISDFQKQAKSAASGPTAELAKKQLPTLRKHLRIAKSLEHKL